MLLSSRYRLLLPALALALSCSGSVRDGRRAADRAHQSLARGDTSAAIQYMERVDLRKTSDPRHCAFLGRLYRETGTINGRLQSQRLLESALQRFPNDPDILTELGKTYFAQTFYPDAIRAFDRALDVDPGRCEAYEYIGLYYFNNWRRLSQYEDDLLAARRHFAAAVECDSTRLRSAVLLANSLYALDRSEEALDFAHRASILFPGVPDFHMLRGAIAYEDGRYHDADREFAAATSRMSDDMIREYSDLYEMLSYKDRSLYEESHESRRESVERAYWIDRDPDPTTPINERRLEHYYRMFLADLYFACYRPPIRGWRTERGAAVVKFGWPWNIERTLGDSWDSGRIERWYYIQHGKMRQFVFEDEYFSGNLRIPIYADSMVVVLRYDPLSSTYRTETIPLPGSFDVAVFKDDQFSCTAYLAARIDADSLQHSVDLGEVNYFYTRAAFFDGEWNAERRYADTLWTSEVPLSRDGQTRYYYVGRKVTLPFDTYHLAYAFEDQKGNARALFKGVSDSFRFVEGELAISDILFQDPSRLHPLSFERGGKTIYPHPGRRYKNGQRLGIYFEVYGLELSRRKSDFDVTFYIYEAPEETPSRWAELGSRFADIVGLGEDRAPAVSQTFRRQGVERTAVEEILIDVDALRPGRYEMVISIHDRVADEVEQASGYFFKVR